MKNVMTIEEMMEKAQSADFQDLLHQLDIELVGSGAQKRLSDNPAIIIDTEQNAYMDYSSGKGGSPADFLSHIHQSEKEKEAEMLCSMMDAGSLKTYYNPKAFSSPEKHETNKHVYCYLTWQKGIDGEVVNSAIKRGTLYETMHERINQDGELKQQYRCVFAGMDSDRNVRSAFVQAAYEREGQKPFQYQVKNSSREHTFNTTGRNENLFVFRDPIDAMREATLEKMNGMAWRDNHRLALNVLDTAAIERYAKEMRGINNIYLCLPEDKTVQFHAKRIQEELTKKGFNVISMPMEMSFEEQLVQRSKDQGIEFAGTQQKQAQVSAENEENDFHDSERRDAGEENTLDILEECEVDDRVFVLAYDPNAEKPYFVYEAVGEEKSGMESYPNRESAVEAMEDRIDELEEAEDLSR